MDSSFWAVEHARLMSLRFMKGRKLSRLVEMLYYAYLNIGVGYVVQQRIQQLKCEKETDLIVSKMLDAVGIKHDANGSKILSVANALKTASKKGNGKQGFPEYTAKVKDFILVIEDKADTAHQAKYIKGGQKDNNVLLMDSASIKNFAENGAVHYAQKIVAADTPFKHIFAFGCSGNDENGLRIRPIYVGVHGYRLMPYVKDFSAFAPDKIETYFREQVCEKKPVKQVEVEEILKLAAQMHEDLHNFAGLTNTEKPLVVSALLLALREDPLLTEKLVQDPVESDGAVVLHAVEKHMKRVKVQPDVKKQSVLAQFEFIRNQPKLSGYNSKLGSSPLRYFAEYLDSKVLASIQSNTPEDVLGRFYGEFFSYGGGDGQNLGIVLTPRHITELFAELAEVKPSDKVFDPCCGTGGFLIAAMTRMLGLAKTDSEKSALKANNLHGIDVKDFMFAISTTNMILRGDGKSNLRCADFLEQDVDTLRKEKFTVGLMNPPYSLAKNKATAHLSEIKFVRHLLDSLGNGARCVVIVPQSTMVGKSQNDKDDKLYILQNHTLEGVITLNTDTFYGVGTNAVIAVFTAHKPHPKNKLSKFVDFRDDGYVVRPHVGLVATDKVDEKRKRLLDCWQQGKPAPKSFILWNEVSSDDEWLHAFYYFNEEIPSEADFEKTMADYLTFEFDMITHGHGYLFEDGGVK